MLLVAHFDIFITDVVSATIYLRKPKKEKQRPKLENPRKTESDKIKHEYAVPLS